VRYTACSCHQASAALPDDVEALKRLVIGRDETIAKLLAEIARLKRWRFGRSAERMDAALLQLQLSLDDLQHLPEVESHDQAVLPLEESTHTPPSQPLRRLRRVSRALPAHLPRETIVHAPTSCTCPDCGAAMRKLGEDISEQLDFIPGTFKVLVHVRPKLSCAHCARVIQLPAPSRPIERALPAPGLLAQVIVAKYADHCPLYRQAGIYRRSGVELDRATLAEWVGGASWLLDPLVDALGRYVLAPGKVHADDTPVPVLDPGRGKTKTGRLWTYVRDDRPSGSHDPPAVGIATRPIARRSIHRPTCAPSTASCRPMPTPGSLRCTRVSVSSRPRAGRTRDASSTTFTSRTTRRLPPRRSSASARCTPSSARSAGGPRVSVPR
jgi:transposase